MNFFSSWRFIWIDAAVIYSLRLSGRNQYSISSNNKDSPKTHTYYTSPYYTHTHAKLSLYGNCMCICVAYVEMIRKWVPWCRLVGLKDCENMLRVLKQNEFPFDKCSADDGNFLSTSYFIVKFNGNDSSPPLFCTIDI